MRRFVLLVVAGSAFAAAGTLVAQTSHVGARNWTPPKTAWGEPDLQGTWTNETITPFERPTASRRQAVSDGRGSRGHRTSGGQAARQRRLGRPPRRRRQLQPVLVRFGHQGGVEPADVAGRRSAGRPRAAASGGGEDSRRGRRAERGLVRVHEPVGPLHHARRARRLLPGRLQQRLSDPADARLRRDPLRDDPRRPRHSDRGARISRPRSGSGTAIRSAGGTATRWSSTSPTTTARAGSPPMPRRDASRASRRATPCTSSSASRAPTRRRFTTRSRSTIPRSTRGRGRSRFLSNGRTAT